MARPTLVSLTAGVQGWDAQVSTNFTNLFNVPLAIRQHTGNESDLNATFGAGSYDRCLVWVNHTVRGWTLYWSTGSAWQISQFNRPYMRAITGAATVQTYDDVILAGTSGSGYAVTLESAATAGAGRRITVKRTGTDVVTVTRAGSDTIDGATTYALNTQYDAVVLISDGTNWHALSNHP